MPTLTRSRSSAPASPVKTSSPTKKEDITVTHVDEAGCRPNSKDEIVALSDNEEEAAQNYEEYYNDEQEEFITIDANGVAHRDDMMPSTLAVDSDSEDEPNVEAVFPSDPIISVIDRSSTAKTNGSEIIYSSIPPDVNVETINRLTHTTVNGENLEIIKLSDGKLRVRSLFGMMQDSAPTSHFDFTHPLECIVCDRTIQPGEMFLNFPDDLDRRRVWGTTLGFKYNDMLRVRMSRMVTTGVICTDHFSEECFRLYNFNKAAIEAFGVPKGASPQKAFIRSRPWGCTVCDFTSFSVADTHAHIVKRHFSDSEIFLERPSGVGCPFCRKCTYGYKTLNGFKRHLQTPPTDHGHLKRVFETARGACRSSFLEPAFEWSSWTERNVCLAYYGYEPPQRTPLKRKHSSKEGGEGESPEKRNAVRVLNVEGEEEKRKDSTDHPTLTKEDRMSSSIGVEGSVPHVEKEVEIAADPDVQYPLTEHMYVCKDTLGDSVPILDPVVAHTPSKRVFPFTVWRRPSAPTGPPIIIPNQGNGNGFTLADALDTTEPIDEDEEVIRKPFVFNPVLPDDNGDEKITKRRIESVEARLRLFGDCSLVEVPAGYKQIETMDGPRLVPITDETIGFSNRYVARY